LGKPSRLGDRGPPSADDPGGEQREPDDPHQHEGRSPRTTSSTRRRLRGGGRDLRTVRLAHRPSTRQRSTRGGADGRAGRRGFRRRSSRAPHRPSPGRTRRGGSTRRGSCSDRREDAGGRDRDGGARTHRRAWRTASPGRGLRRLGRRSAWTDTDGRLRRRSRRRLLLARPRRLAGFPRREERERIDVTVWIGGQANAEMDVRLGPLGIAARADGADDLPLLDRRPHTHADRPQVDERDRIPVRGANRQAQPFVRKPAREGHDPARGSTDIRAARRADVDAPVLAPGVRVFVGDERSQHRAVDRPAPGRRTWCKHERCEQHGGDSVA